MSELRDVRKKYDDKWFKSVETNWSSIIGCNALLFAFSLPLIAWLVICQCYSALLAGASMHAGGHLVLTFLGLLPCAEIYTVGLAGALWANKNILWDEKMNTARRFAEGIRRNAPKYMLFTLIMWASSALAVITPSLYSFTELTLLIGAGSVTAVVQALVLMPAMCLAMVECVFFEDGLKDHLKNAFKIYFLKPFRVLGITLLSAAPFAVCAILPFIWQLAFWVIYATVGVSFGIIFYLVQGKKIFDGIIAKSRYND